MNNLRSESKINKVQLFILSNFALLLFILNIPGTIALRNILAGTLLIVLSLMALKNENSFKVVFKNKKFKNILLMLLVLTSYLFLHTIFIADELNWSLSQYRTQWIYPMLYFGMGVLLAFFSHTNNYFNKEQLITILFFSLFAHVLYIDIVAVNNYIESGLLITRYGGLTESPVLANYITNILNAVILVEFIYRFRMKKRVINIHSFVLFIILLLCIFSSIIEGMRFGVISLFFMSLTGAIFVVIDNQNFNLKVKGFVAFSMLFLCMTPLLYNAVNDDRWTSLIETIPIAIDTESHLYWQGDISKIPLLKNGEEVDHSNYMRIAWASKGIDYIMNDVLGIGYGKNAFGHAIEKYDGGQSIRGYHSHSSIIDFTIGVGLIGLMLWLFLIFRIILYTSSEFIFYGNYFALLSLFITTGFFIRSTVDSNMRDHMFKQFFLILGISLALSFYESNKRKKHI
jgi:hypothetical protein